MSLPFNHIRNAAYTDRGWAHYHEIVGVYFDNDSSKLVRAQSGDYRPLGTDIVRRVPWLGFEATPFYNGAPLPPNFRLPLIARVGADLGYCFMHVDIWNSRYGGVGLPHHSEFSNLPGRDISGKTSAAVELVIHEPMQALPMGKYIFYIVEHEWLKGACYVGLDFLNEHHINVLFSRDGNSTNDRTYLLRKRLHPRDPAFEDALWTAY